MSFSYKVKTEICEAVPTTKCCSLAACYGILLYCHTFSSNEIRIVTGNEAFASLLPKLFRRAFGFGFDTITEKKGTHAKQSFLIQSPERLTAVFNKFGYDRSGALSHHVNLGVLEDECCRLSFLKGAFLAGGSITDPTKGYHAELVTGHYSVSKETSALLYEAGFRPGETSRKGSYILYYKQSSVIEDLLTTLGASLAAMDVMAAKIEKDMMNSVNRQVNCDTANVKKTVDTAAQHIKAIRTIERATGLDALPGKCKETALLRIEFPEESTAQLAERHTPPISKSCVNHRLRKIMEIYSEIPKGPHT